MCKNLYFSDKFRIKFQKRAPSLPTIIQNIYPNILPYLLQCYNRLEAFGCTILHYNPDQCNGQPTRIIRVNKVIVQNTFRRQPISLTSAMDATDRDVLVMTNNKTLQLSTAAHSIGISRSLHRDVSGLT